MVLLLLLLFIFFFFKQKTAYEMRISDWSSDVCSSDLGPLSPSGESEARRVRAGLEDGQADPVGSAHSLRRRALAGTSDGPVRSGRVDRWRGGREIGRASCRERVCQYV